VKIEGQTSFVAMPRLKPRFRISLRDYDTGKTLCVDLVTQPFPGSKRYWLRVDGRNATRLPEASLTVVFHRLRSWLVKQRTPKRTPNELKQAGAE